jgi:GWxTD domain-containing protein
MSFLEAWVASPLAAAAGWALLHSLWEGALIAAALSAVLWAVRQARVRYAAACAAMLLMLAAFGLTFVRMMPRSAAGLRNVPYAHFPGWNVQTGAGASGATPTGLAAIAPWLTPFWIAGVWIFYLAQITGWVSVFRLRRRGVCCAPEPWQREFMRLRARLRLARPVQLLESCLAEAPMVLGHFRPVVLMPVGVLAGLTPGQIEAILLHELAHIRRCDYLVNAFQRVLDGLFFYHPAVWWISRVIRAEREDCCDDFVVRASGNAREYAQALAALEQNRCSGREAAVAATGGSIVRRIHRLLYPKTRTGAWTPLFAALIIIVTAAVAMSAWQSEPSQQSAAPQKQRDRAETPRFFLFQNKAVVYNNPYDKWLNQDVVYIIDDAERAAFLKLTTDAERDRFIEQFWLRRDPTPGTPRNEFKDEHYRRIAFANQRFRTASGMPGWQTDRGHMYILYGPPDEIESHPRGARAAYEIWMYHHVEGIGENVTVTFVDHTGRGDYRLAPGNGQ